MGKISYLISISQRMRISVFTVICAAFFSFAGAYDQYEEVKFNKEDLYDVYYQVSDNDLYKLENVHIFGIKTIAQRPFLVVYKEAFTSQQTFYVAIDSIKSFGTPYHQPMRAPLLFDGRGKGKK